MECRECRHWERAEALVPLGFGACRAVVAHIVDFTGVRAAVRRVNREGQGLESEPVEFVTDGGFWCASFEKG